MFDRRSLRTETDVEGRGICEGLVCLAKISTSKAWGREMGLGNRLVIPQTRRSMSKVKRVVF